MFVDDAVPPVLYSWWVPALGALLLVLAALWVWFALRKRTGESPRRMQTEAQAADTRVTFLARFETEYNRFLNDEIDLRDFHLRVANLTREFGTARMGRNILSMSRAEVEEAFPRMGIGVLLRRCEQPSFSRDSRAEAHTTMTKVHEVVERW